MLVYNYNNDENQYTHSNEADESPLEKGVFFIPAKATDIAPPITIEHQVAIFENNGWVIKEDYRGINACDIDENSIFIKVHEMILGEVPSNTLILADAPNSGLYSAKWNGTAWIENLTQAQIDAIIASIPPVPKTTEEMNTERIANTELAINQLMSMLMI